MSKKKVDADNDLLAKVGETRRTFIRTVAAGTAFVVPLVASFSTNGLRFNEAAAGGNQPQNAQGDNNNRQGSNNNSQGGNNNSQGGNNNKQ
jgi:hypothetical protein